MISLRTQMTPGMSGKVTLGREYFITAHTLQTSFLLGPPKMHNPQAERKGETESVCS